LNNIQVIFKSEVVSRWFKLWGIFYRLLHICIFCLFAYKMGNSQDARVSAVSALV